MVLILEVRHKLELFRIQLTERESCSCNEENNFGMGLNIWNEEIRIGTPYIGTLFRRLERRNEN